MQIPLVYSPFYSYRFPANHQFPMSKFHHLHRYLSDLGLLTDKNVFRPGRIKPEFLQLTHQKQYIHEFQNDLLSAKALRKMGLPWSPELVKRSMISPNGTLLTAAIALNHGIACHLAGGTHHAHYDHGRGYCVFNDLAITAKTLVAEGKVKRILIFDCDVHQGDGTAAILANNPDIFTCSIHCQKNFPHHKANSDLDLGLAAGLEDQAYLHAVQKTLLAAIKQSQPDLILYDAGVDIYAADNLGLLNVSAEGIYQRELRVLKLIKEHQIPVATVIGGGYDKDQKALARRHAYVFQAAHRIFNKNETIN